MSAGSPALILDASHGLSVPAASTPRKYCVSPITISSMLSFWSSAPNAISIRIASSAGTNSSVTAMAPSTIGSRPDSAVMRMDSGGLSAMAWCSRLRSKSDASKTGAVGSGVGVAVGVAVGLGLGVGVGAGVAVGLGLGVAVAVGAVVAVAVAVGAAVTGAGVLGCAVGDTAAASTVGVGETGGGASSPQAAATSITTTPTTRMATPRQSGVGTLRKPPGPHASGSPPWPGDPPSSGGPRCVQRGTDRGAAPRLRTA